jgi:hypothetical protein
MKRIAKDKWKHFFVGIIMGLLLQVVFGWLMPHHYLIATLMSFFMVTVVSYGFELYSKFTGHGHYEMMDAVAAIIGGVIGITFGSMTQLVF